MDPKAAAVKLAGWEQVIIAANNSGMTKKEWCAENGVGIKQFYYWQRKVRTKAIETMNALKATTETSMSIATVSKALAVAEPSSEFVEMAIPDSPERGPGRTVQAVPQYHIDQPEMLLEIDDCRLYIPSGIQEQTLAVVLKAIRHA